MYQHSRDKTGECAIVGHNAEELFVAEARARGYKIRKAKLEEQFSHKDFFLSKENMEFSVDVKARKKVSRRNKNFNDDWIWLELTSVNGKPGWLRSGPDFIAFERERDFVLSNREILYNWLVNESPAKESIESKDYVDSARQAKYKIYRRRGRKDELVQVRIEDILALETTTCWDKNS
jgi:hypothetical protein|tara:strand:+ start:16927 stop:17460 length:534 start_codon:yes stop_codon:yes gene_type:complete